MGFLTLIIMTCPCLSITDVQTIWRGVFNFEMFIKNYTLHFKEWLLELSEGFNVILYGIGSKIKITEQFHNAMLKDKAYIVINGFESQTTVKSVTNAVAYLLNIPIKGSIVDYIKAIHNNIIETLMTRCEKEHYYIIINSLDSRYMQHEALIEFLVGVARCERVHILATVDKVNCALLWDEETAGLRGFNWIWHHTPTFMPYSAETLEDDELQQTAMDLDNEFAKVNPANTLEDREGNANDMEKNDTDYKSVTRRGNNTQYLSLTRVLTSLTLNAKNIFALIAKDFIDSRPDRKKFKGTRSTEPNRFIVGDDNHIECEGMPFQDLLRMCREEFYVSNDASLRTHLREFVDHGIIKLKFDDIGVERIYMCVTKDVVEGCLEEHLKGCD